MHHPLRSLLVAAGLTVSLSIAALAAPPGTSFAYQGLLASGGNPVDTPVTVTFRLFDAASGGNQIGGNSVQVVHPEQGVFTTSLDFGVDAYAFNQALWLEIEVEGDLLGRQKLEATPFALNTRGITVLPDGGLEVGVSPDTPQPSTGIVSFGHHTGLVGLSDFENGAAVWGTNYLPNGFGMGGRFDALSPDGVGVYGSGGFEGGFFVSTRQSGDSYGVYARSFFSPTGVGVRAESRSETGPTKGIHASVDSPDGFAGYFEGGKNYFEGRVGIGMDAPTHTLEVNGNFTVDSNGSRRFTVRSDGRVAMNSFGGAGVSCLIQQVPGDSIVLSAADINAVDKFWVESTGDTRTTRDAHIWRNAHISQDLFVGGDTTVDGRHRTLSQTYIGPGGYGNVALHVNLPYEYGINLQQGDAGKPGGGSWASTSDVRLKKNISPLSNALDTLLELRGVHFEYQDPSAIGELPGIRTGFIAQEAERVLPDWVWEAEDGYKRMTIRGFEALAVEALRELRTEKDEQIAAVRRQARTEIAALQADNAELRTRLERVEALLTRLAAEPGD